MFPGYPSYVSIPAARTNLLSNALSTLGSSLDLSSPAFSNHTPLSSVVSPLMLNPACIQQMQSLQGLHIPGLASSAVLSMLNNSSPNITSEQGIHLENGLFLPNDRISSILNCFGYADLNSSMLTAEPSAPIAPANIDTLNAGNLNNSGLVKECDSHTIIRAPVLYKTSTTAVSSRTGKISTGSNSACQESPPDRIVASYAAAAHAVALAKQQPLSNAAEAFLSSVSPSGAGSSSSNSSVSRSGKTNGGGSRRYAYSNNPQLHSRPNLATTVKVSSTTSCSSRTPGINSKAVLPQTPGLTGAILTTSSSTIEPNKMTACANSKARCGWSRIVDRLAASVTYISPDGTRLRNLDEVCLYFKNSHLAAVSSSSFGPGGITLTALSTCFNFDPTVDPSPDLGNSGSQGPTPATSLSGSLSNHSYIAVPGPEEIVAKEDQTSPPGAKRTFTASSICRISFNPNAIHDETKRSKLLKKAGTLSPKENKDDKSEISLNPEQVLSSGWMAQNNSASNTVQKLTVDNSSWPNIRPEEPLTSCDSFLNPTAGDASKAQARHQSIASHASEAIFHAYSDGSLKIVQPNESEIERHEQVVSLLERAILAICSADENADSVSLYSKYRDYPLASADNSTTALDKSTSPALTSAPISDFLALNESTLETSIATESQPFATSPIDFWNSKEIEDSSVPSSVANSKPAWIRRASTEKDLTLTKMSTETLTTSALYQNSSCSGPAVVPSVVLPQSSSLCRSDTTASSTATASLNALTGISCTPGSNHVVSSRAAGLTGLSSLGEIVNSPSSAAYTASYDPASVVSGPPSNHHLITPGQLAYAARLLQAQHLQQQQQHQHALVLAALQQIQVAQFLAGLNPGSAPGAPCSQPTGASVQDLTTAAVAAQSLALQEQQHHQHQQLQLYALLQQQAAQVQQQHQQQQAIATAMAFIAQQQHQQQQNLQARQVQITSPSVHQQASALQLQAYLSSLQQQHAQLR